MANMFRVRGNPQNRESLKDLGFVFNNSEENINKANMFMCDVRAKACVAFNIPSNTRSPKHQPMIKIEHVAPLMLLPDLESRILYLEQVTGRMIRLAYPTIPLPK